MHADPAATSEVDARSALVIGGWIAVNLAISIDMGTYQPTALALMIVAAVLTCVTAAMLRRDGSWTALDPRIAAAAAAANLAVAIQFNVPFYKDDRGYAMSIDLAVLAAALALAVTLVPVAYRRVLALLAIPSGAASLALIITIISKPNIDVWFILTEGSRRMAGGHNIFTSCWPGNTDPLTDCIYPYLPVTTIVQTPFRWVFGDIRYSYVAALLISAAVIWRLGGRVWGPVLAALLLASPSIRILVELAWTEPLLLLGLAVMVLGALRGRTVMAVLGFAFALACKQHVLLLIPLAAWWPAFGWRRTAMSLTGATFVTMPWFVVDPTAFVDDAVRFNINLEPRADSLSLFTTAMNAGWEPHFFFVGALTIAAIAAVLRYLPRTATGFVLGSALVLFAFNLLNKQSFFNQWWLVGALLLLTAATAIAESEISPRPAATLRHPPDVARSATPGSPSQ